MAFGLRCNAGRGFGATAGLGLIGAALPTSDAVGLAVVLAGPGSSAWAIGFGAGVAGTRERGASQLLALTPPLVLPEASACPDAVAPLGVSCAVPASFAMPTNLKGVAERHRCPLRPCQSIFPLIEACLWKLTETLCVLPPDGLAGGAGGGAAVPVPVPLALEAACI
jgi:hypothetical protein